VINGNYPVGKKTRQRVLKAMKDLGYSPNHVARSLALQSTSTIGVVCTDLKNPYFVEMIEQIQLVTAGSSLQLLLQNTSVAENERDAVQLLLDRRVDAIIFIAHHEELDDVEHITSTAKMVPVVLIGQELPGTKVMSICAEEEQGMYTLGKQLLQLGHRNVLFLGGKEGSHPTEVKLRGLRNAFALNNDVRLEVELTGYQYTAANVLEDRIAGGLLQWCTAIVAVSDYVAIGALNVLDANGIRVPTDITVTGFDNIFWATCVRPKLTTVEPNKELLAQNAVHAIMNALDGQASIGKVLVPSELILRGSHRSIISK